jgi:hypothetical protein
MHGNCKKKKRKKKKRNQHIVQITVIHAHKSVNISGMVKVKQSLCFFLTKHHSMKAYWGEWRYSFRHSLNLALHRREWSASRLGRFIPRERAPGTHWIGGWVGPRAVLDAVMKRKIPGPSRESNLDSRSSSP